MISVTLSPEQMRSAPPPVRHWLEQQIAATLASMGESEPAAPPNSHPHLVAATAEEVETLLRLVKALPPAIHLLLELGRAGQSVPGRNLVVFNAASLAQSAHLDSVEQLLQCISMLNVALAEVRRDPGALLIGVDEGGHCFVHGETHRGLQRLWRQLIETSLAQLPDAVSEGDFKRSADSAPDPSIGPLSLAPANMPGVQTPSH